VTLAIAAKSGCPNSRQAFPQLVKTIACEPLNCS
jgi:hypothetical protein